MGGGARDACTPLHLAQNVFIFMQFLGKISQIIGWRTPSGKSWIRYQVQSDRRSSSENVFSATEFVLIRACFAGASAMSPSTILEEWHKEEEKAKQLFQRYKDMASEKGVRYDTVIYCCQCLPSKMVDIMFELKIEQNLGSVFIECREGSLLFQYES